MNIKKNSDETFGLSEPHLVEKITNNIRLTVSTSLKSIDTPDGKSLLHKEKSSLGRKCVFNYRTVVGMLSYLQGST